jgi:hypothetical protein
LTALFLEQIVLEHIDIAAELSESLVVTVRKNIEGITVCCRSSHILSCSKLS